MLCYRKETDQIFARAKVGKIVVKEVKGIKNYYAHYRDYERLKKPIFLEDLLGRVRLRDLRKPSPDTTPINKQTFEAIIKAIESGAL